MGSEINMIISIRLKLILWLLKLICFISKPGKGVIELTKTATRPKKKVKKKKTKAVVTHKRINRTSGEQTACGLSLYDVEKSNKNWPGVTCGRCKNTTEYKNRKNKKGGK
jgi:hypothetical protein